MESAGRWQALYENRMMTETGPEVVIRKMLVNRKLTPSMAVQLQLLIRSKADQEQVWENRPCQRISAAKRVMKSSVSLRRRYRL